MNFPKKADISAPIISLQTKPLICPSWTRCDNSAPAGGAYLGVGPEQNFTYIAKIRPRIAFIIDIRRQAIIQHLMYKAVFHLSSNRLQFLSRLLSKPLPKEKVPSPDAPINDLLSFFAQTPADDKTYEANLAAIRKVIQEEFQFPLSADDQKSLEYVYKSFRSDGLDISYRMDGVWARSFPTFKEIIEGTDQNGKQGNFLASVDDYDFVRGLHQQKFNHPCGWRFRRQKSHPGGGRVLKEKDRVWRGRAAARPRTAATWYDWR